MTILQPDRDAQISAAAEEHSVKDRLKIQKLYSYLLTKGNFRGTIPSNSRRIACAAERGAIDG
jgi:hypothetical protein